MSYERIEPQYAGGGEQTTGIVRGGESLKQHRDRVLDATRGTGHYAGLQSLALRDEEPIRYNKMFSRLRAGVVDARETAKRIAASPIVEQEGELCFTLYNAAGDAIVTSTGIIIHVGTMGAAIKYMIENDWEHNPGVQDKDIFCNNDSLIGNVHPCDIHTIVPIFWEGKLVGWVGVSPTSSTPVRWAPAPWPPGRSSASATATRSPAAKSAPTTPCSATGCTRASAWSAPPVTGCWTNAPGWPAAT